MSPMVNACAGIVVRAYEVRRVTLRVGLAIPVIRIARLEDKIAHRHAFWHNGEWFACGDSDCRSFGILNPLLLSIGMGELNPVRSIGAVSNRAVQISGGAVGCRYGRNVGPIG